MAYQAKQVFYVKDPCNEKWSVVIQGKTEYDIENHYHDIYLLSMRKMMLMKYMLHELITTKEYGKTS